jgi:hypothetical protein
MLGEGWYGKEIVSDKREFSKPTSSGIQCYTTIGNMIFKGKLSLHAVRTHYKQFMLFPWTEKNVCAFVSALMVDTLSMFATDLSKLQSCLWLKIYGTPV